MNGRLSALVSAILLSLFTMTALASAAAGDFAKGRGATLQERFSFSAKGTGALDRADGRMSQAFTFLDPNITVTGDVTCMLIVGKSASIGGRITGFKPAGTAAVLGNPQGFIIFAEDNAKPSEGLDGYSFSFETLPPPACPAPFPFGGNVITGDIEIIPGLP